MLLDRAWHMTFRNFSTMFLLVASITVPLHLLHGFVFRDVATVHRLHDEIEAHAGNSRVRGVSARDIATARAGYFVINLAELALVPLLTGAIRRVVEQDSEGELPGLGQAWAGARARITPIVPRKPGPVLVALVFATALGFLIERSGLLLSDLLANRIVFAGHALAQGLARAVAAPWFLTALAVASTPDDG